MEINSDQIGPCHLDQDVILGVRNGDPASILRAVEHCWPGIRWLLRQESVDPEPLRERATQFLCVAIRSELVPVAAYVRKVAGQLTDAIPPVERLPVIPATPPLEAVTRAMRIVGGLTARERQIASAYFTDRQGVSEICLSMKVSASDVRHVIALCRRPGGIVPMPAEATKSVATYLLSA